MHCCGVVTPGLIVTLSCCLMVWEVYLCAYPCECLTWLLLSHRVMQQCAKGEGRDEPPSFMGLK